MGIELPQTVEMTVIETEPGLKIGDRFQRDQAGEDRDRTGRAGAAVYQ